MNNTEGGKAVANEWARTLQIGLVTIDVVLRPAQRKPEPLGKLKHRVVVGKREELHDIEQRYRCKDEDRLLEKYEEVVPVSRDGVVLDRPLITDQHLVGLNWIKRWRGLSEEFFYDHYYVEPDPDRDPAPLFALRGFLAEKGKPKMLLVSVAIQANKPARAGLIEARTVMRDGQGTQQLFLHRLKFEGEYIAPNQDTWVKAVARIDVEKAARYTEQLKGLLKDYELKDELDLIEHPRRAEQRRQILEAVEWAAQEAMQRSRKKTAKATR